MDQRYFNVLDFRTSWNTYGIVELADLNAMQIELAIKTSDLPVRSMGRISDNFIKVLEKSLGITNFGVAIGNFKKSTPRMAYSNFKVGSDLEVEKLFNVDGRWYCYIWIYDPDYPLGLVNMRLKSRSIGV